MSSIAVIDTNEFAEKLGLSDHLESDPNKTSPSPWGIARFIRREVRRRGLATRRELRKKIEPYLVASGFSIDARTAINSVANQMVDVGELAELKVENQRGYSALPSRWIRFSDTDAVLLGTVGTETHRFDSFHPKQFLRRFRPSDKIIADLDSLGVKEQSFEAWLGEPGWKQLVDFKTQVESLDQLLEFHLAQLDHKGAPLSLEDTRVLAIAHRPGDFFGQAWNPKDTRWTAPKLLKDGVYVGAQPGYTERQWHPILLKIDGETAMSIPLHAGNDPKSAHDLRSWLLIALGDQKGMRERLDFGDEIELTFQAPQQLRRSLNLFGETTNGWHYSVLDRKSVRDLLAASFPQVRSE